jgi:predicted small secreted protein
MNRHLTAKHRNAMLALLLLGAALILPACNTTRGAGKDIEKAGEGLQRSAEKHGAD